jgi:tetratricopeptide (TPR) repeat protein
MSNSKLFFWLSIVLALLVLYFVKTTYFDHHDHHDHDHDHNHTHNHGHQHSGAHEQPMDAPLTPQLQMLLEKAANLEEAVRQHPDDSKKLLMLGNIYLQLYRSNPSHSEYPAKASALAEQVLKKEPGNTEAQMLKTTLLLTFHRFEEAAEMARLLVNQFPNSAFAYGALCDANIELGKYEEAVKACDKMLSLRPDLRSYSRAAYLRELHGDLPGAIAAMTMAAKAGLQDSEQRAWALSQLARLYFQKGDLPKAESIYRNILDSQPQYIHAVIGLTDVISSQKGLEAGIAFLASHHHPDADHLILEKLALMYIANDEAHHAEELVEHIVENMALQTQNGWDVQMEFARFCAKANLQLDKALETIEKEYQRRPNNIDVLDTYAWLMFKKGATDKAKKLIDEALRLNPYQTEKFYHAAEIYMAVGNAHKAKAFQEKFYIDDNILLPAEDLPKAERLATILSDTLPENQLVSLKRP